MLKNHAASINHNMDDLLQETGKGKTDNEVAPFSSVSVRTQTCR